MASLPPPSRRPLRATSAPRAPAAFELVSRASSALLAVAAIALVALLVSALLRAPGVLPQLASLRYEPGRGALGLVGLSISSLLALLAALAVSSPLALAAAVWLADLSPESLRRPLVVLLDAAVAVPSVAVGWWVAAVGGPFLERVFGPEGSGWSLSVVVLVAMSAPTTARVGYAVLTAVPDTLRESAIALGATRWEAARGVVLPVAGRALVGATVLGMSRALGETIAVAMVVGGRPSAAPSLVGASGTLSSVLVDEYLDAFRKPDLAALSAAALVLLGVGALAHFASRALVRRVARGVGA